jgi:hypothetical protein
VTCKCGNDYFVDHEKFDVHSTDPLVVECQDCGRMMQMDCRGRSCKKCSVQCEKEGSDE